MGWTEWLIILVVAALLFRPRGLGKSLGNVAGSFREGARSGPADGAEAGGGHSANTQQGQAVQPGGTSPADERTRLLAVLELPPDADDEQIRRAWRELAKVWHPDRFGQDAALKARATRRLAEINAAYEQLQRRAAP